jgi:hypothetical protein
MKTKRAESFLLDFTANLKSRERLPKNIEVSSLQSGTMANVFDVAPSPIINESVFCGIDPEPATAILKGLVEMIERRAFSEGFEANLPFCKTPRSDGFAAFPKGVVADEKIIARENALAEAIERFVWASWWDNDSIGHSQREINLAALSPGESPLRDLDSAVEIASIVEVRPYLADKNHTVVLYFAFLKPIGVISGGACGRSSDPETIRYRALAELLRHGLAVRKIKTGKSEPVSFYEKRLAYFGLTVDGTKLAQGRIKLAGTVDIELPKLIFDHEVPHSLSDLVSVHRCYFENQPEFVGGKLERLCL